MEIVASKLTNFFKDKGLSQKDVAELMGTSSAYINAILNNRKDVGKKQAAKMGNLFGLSASWLLTGEGEMFTATDAPKSPLAKDDKDGVAPSNFHEITYFPNVDGSMGGVQFMDNSAETREVIVIPGYSDCKLAINAYGDSMHPLIKSGQIVLMAEWQESFIDWGKIYLVVTKSGYRAIKRLFPGSDGEHITCKSENETSHPPFEVERADILKIFIVKGWICRDVI
jgi:phage repressor protein C with HTH and peptisase S24 domain